MGPEPGAPSSPPEDSSGLGGSGAVAPNIPTGAGGSPAADGIHCGGNCTLENVGGEDVGEDAATFEGESDDTRVSIDCGGARAASDKVLQHNGGGTVVVRRFIVETSSDTSS